MPKAILKFNLPDDENEYKIAVYGYEFYKSLLDIDRMIRDWLKYGHDLITKEEILELLRNTITDKIEEI